jgi:DNA-binding Lrp family transcriptional regulator
MDAIDRRILDVIQSGFPVAARPYAELGRDLGLTEAEALARVRALKESGVIRRIGANSSPRAWAGTPPCARPRSARAHGHFVATVTPTRA